MEKEKTIKTSLLEKKNKPKELFDQLFDMWRNEYKEDNKETPKLIIELNKSDGLDFCKLALDAINDGFNCWNALHVLADVIPHLELKMDSTLMLLEEFHKSMQNDLASGLQYAPVAKLIDTQPVFARKLLDELLKQDKPFIAGHISNLYQNLSKNNEHEIHTELTSLKAHPSVYVIQGIVNALGNLDYYNPPKNRNLVKQTVQILDELELRGSTDINFSLVYAYGRLLKFAKEPRKRLLELARKKDPNIDYAISGALIRQIDECGNDEWFAEVLMELATTSCEYKGTIGFHLDHVLHVLIRKKDNWELVENFFTTWLIKSDYAPSDEKLSDLFASTFSLFSSNQNKLERLITSFFNHDSYKLHGAVKEIIDYHNLHKGDPLKLDQSILSPLSFEDLFYIARKILGYVYFSNHQRSLTFSILDKSPRDKKIQELVSSIFVNHIGENYPDATLEFLKKEISKSKSKIKKKVAEDIIKRIENDRDARRSLLRLKELIPPDQQTYLVLLEDHKNMQKAMVPAREKSPILSLATKVPLTYGKGSFSFINY